MTTPNPHRQELAYLGESYVVMELAKRKYRVQKTSQEGFYFDLLGHDGCRIEVKTALPGKCQRVKYGRMYSYKNWQFNLSHPKQAHNDFYVYVVLKDESLPPEGYFVFPRNALKSLNTSGMVSIFESDVFGYKPYHKNKLNRNQYFNNWDLILQWNK